MAMSLSDLLLSVRMNRASFSLIGLNRAANVAFQRSDHVYAHYLLTGSALLHYQDAPPLTLAPGDFVCLNRGTEHHLQGPEPGASQRMAPNQPERSDELASIVFGSGPLQGELLSGVFGLGRQAISAPRFSLPEVMIIRPEQAALSSFEPPAQFIASLHGPGARSFAGSLVKLLYDQAVRRSLLGPTCDGGADLRPTAISKALRLMDGNLSERWTVVALAESVGMSRSAFAAAFTATTGEPPLTRLARLRMQEALRLVEQSTLSIGEVAVAVGYQSQSAFTRAFTQQFDNAPRNLRSRAMRG